MIITVIAEDADVDIVVETMGGTKPALRFCEKLRLLSRKERLLHPTKNWWLLMEQSLLQIAREQDGQLLCLRLSVGGGIPIIRPLNQCITADEIESDQWYFKWNDKLYSDENGRRRGGF